MQKTFIAIALALAFTCTFAAYTPSNYVKAPIGVVTDGETNFTNQSGLGLGSVATGELDLISVNIVENKTSIFGANFAIWYRKLDSKALTGTANSTVTLYSPAKYSSSGWVFTLDDSNSTGSPTVANNIKVYQSPWNGGAPGPIVNASSNTNASFIPKVLAVEIIGKNVYVFHTASETKVNVTTFTVGGAAGKLDATLTDKYQKGVIFTTWGEALGNNIYVGWWEADVLKTGTFDTSKGTNNAANVDKWDKNYQCRLYSTDKKLFGVLCSNVTNATSGETFYFVSTTNNTLVPLTNNSNATNNALASVIPYGPYIAIFYNDLKTTVGSNLQSYEIWNLDNLTPFKGRTAYLTIDGASTVQPYRIVAGGYYTLLYNKRKQDNETLTSVQVGLLLGSSYLASVFGFLLTIIAGLFLF